MFKKLFYKVRNIYRTCKIFGLKVLFLNKSRVEDLRRVRRNRKTTIQDRKKYGNGYMSRKRKVKTSLFRRDGNICFWCGERMTFKTATIDHIVPASVERNNDLNNLRLIHDECRRQRDLAIITGDVIIK